MVFTPKPNKPDSLNLSDKRKISLLNADFKILTGIENKRHTKILDHTVSPLQFALGKSKSIHQAIGAARDAVFFANKKNQNCAIADLDFKAAFDFLCMDWVFLVLEKKGLHSKNIERLKRYYQNSITIPVINNIPGRKITNHRLTLRQGDCPSSAWFGFGVDPLLSFLEKDYKE